MHAIISNKESAAKQPDILGIINAFFEKFTLDECKEEIWTLLVSHCSQEPKNLPDGIELGNTAFFCANIDFLLNGLHILWEFYSSQESANTIAASE
jgi:hypothetical protein